MRFVKKKSVNKKKGMPNNFYKFVIMPLISLLTGYGMFWAYMQALHNVWLSMLVGGYVAVIIHHFIIAPAFEKGIE